MKKRLLSIVLTVCMIIALFPVMTAQASAANTVEYTMKKGDTVSKVCKELGIDFYANYNWIVKVNNITNFNKIPAGKTLTLPAPGTKPSLDDVPGASGSGTTTAPTPTPAAGSGTASGKLLSGDYVSEYLVYHTMVAGETVSGVCKTLGVNFAANSDRIMKMNNIKSWNRIPAGRAILLPCVSLPSSGTCLRVIAHTVVRGDTTYGICRSYGVDYNGYATILKALNKKDNLGSIKAGQILYIVVPATITNGQAGGSNPGGSNPGSSTKPEDSKTYNINANTTNANYGSYTVSAKTAKAGATVTIKATPKTNYALGGFTVKDSSGNSVKLTYSDDGNSATFNMPSSDVTISVSFVSATQYNIWRLDPNGKYFTTQVNGKAVDKAPAGAIVTIVSAAEYHKEIKSITINSSSTVTMVDDDSFIMPANEVSISVDISDMSEYHIYFAQNEGGSAKAILNGKEVGTALAGETIKVEPEPVDGYKLKSISVTSAATGLAVSFNSSANTFTMPRSDANVSVVFEKIDYNVTTNVGENGSYTVSVNGGSAVNAENGKAVTTAHTQDSVSLAIAPDKGYIVDKVTVGNNDISCNDNTAAFTMEPSDTTVSVTFKKASYQAEAVLNDETSSFTISANGSTASGGGKINVSMGDTVTVNADSDLVGWGYIIEKVKITGKTSKSDLSSSCTIASDGKSATFTMPAESVYVKVLYTKSS